MKIVIIGSGEIGFHLSKLLSGEHHDVTVLDHDIETLQKLTEHCDVLTVDGEATSVKNLIAAGVVNADMVVAATDIDEINMVVSMISKRLGTKRVIARVRNDELFRNESLLKPSDMGIDLLIHPEEHVAGEIVRLIKRAAASDLIALADNRLQLVGIRLDETSHLIDKSIEAYAEMFSHISFRVVAILRGGRTIIPDGETLFKKSDHIFILTHIENVPQAIASTGRTEKKIKRIMIAGGTAIGIRVAEILSREDVDWRIKLIEPGYEKGLKLVQKLRNVLILQGEPTDPDLLVSEGIMDTDAFISVTQDEESNIISCLMAKHLGVSKTVALVSKAEYIPLSQTIGLDSAVNMKLSVTNEIHRQIRKGKVISNYSPYGTDAEILELRVSPHSKAINVPVENLTLPAGVLIGAIIHKDDVLIATGKARIHAGDHIILFCRPDALNKVTSYFS